MNKSDEIDKLAAALCKVQKVLEGTVKGSVNPFFRSKYASLPDVWASCRELITEHGLTITQGGDGENYETTLIHTSGQWISYSQKLHIKAGKDGSYDMQGLGSAITYARRYGIQSVLGMSSLDDDGEASMQRGGGQSNVTMHRGILRKEVERMSYKEREKLRQQGR